jgi:amino-acid N-acetyltransferase
MLYRKATFNDVEAMHKLVNSYAEQGLMLARSRNVLYETLRDFIVAEDDGEIVGIGALHLTWDKLAEIRAMAVAPGRVKAGIGRNIVNVLIEEAAALEILRIFTLTYQPGFFGKLGFTEITKEELPHKVWKECINCAKFPNCDETAMIRDLKATNTEG